MAEKCGGQVRVEVGSSEPTSMDFYLITHFEGWLPVPFKLDAVRSQAARSSGFTKVAFPTLNIISSELDCSSPRVCINLPLTSAAN